MSPELNVLHDVIKIINHIKVHVLKSDLFVQLCEKMDTEHTCLLSYTEVTSVQSLSCVQLFVTPWTAAHQASLSITNSRSLPKLMSIESVMPSNHLILCRPLLLLPSILPSIRVFSNKSALSHQVAKILEFQFQHQSFHKN